MLFDLRYIDQQLQNALYEPKLGIRLAHISSTEVRGEKIALVAVKIDPGKHLSPHLHEVDGEICIPLSEGNGQLGNARKDSSGSYIVTGDKVEVDWEKSQKLIPGEAF